MIYPIRFACGFFLALALQILAPTEQDPLVLCLSSGCIACGLLYLFF